MRAGKMQLVAFKYVAGVDLVEDVVQTAVVAVGDDGLALCLELGEVVDDLTTEEGLAIGDGGFVDDDLGALGLDALHDALDGTLAEIVRVALHGQAIDANDTFLLLGGIPLAVAVVIAGLTQHLVGNEVLTGAVALHNGGHHVLGNIGIVGQQLFGILGQAVAAIAEAGVVIVGTDTGVEADTRDDSLGVETLDLGIGIEFVEVADTESEVGVGKEFYSFCLGHTHQETRDTLVDV